jgi:subtilisin family serine protease
MPVLGLHCFMMEIRKPDGAADLASLLSRDPRVAWAQPVQAFHAMTATTGDDPLYPLQPVARAWHLTELHHAALGRGVRVAVVDSGIDSGHPDLAGQIERRENFVDGKPYEAEMHGTAIAGIIAARAGNGLGIVGVAPGARLLALRACWQQAAGDTACDSFSLAKALQAAIVQGADVINLSLAGPDDRLLRALLDRALQHGITLVGAVDARLAGGGFPASHPGVLAVAEAVPENEPAARILLAPGRDVPSTLPGARWGFVSGASFAAAEVSGLVALIVELRPGLGPQRVREALRAGRADAIGAVDACAVLARFGPACSCSCIASRAGADALR